VFKSIFLERWRILLPVSKTNVFQNSMIDLSYIGSFQRGTLFRSENPLEELWAQIGRIGTPEYAGSLIPNKPDHDWEKHAKYASVRIRQALELRKSTSGTSLLTKPILLYYSFLNLLRAFMAITPKIIPKPKHGLIFKPNNQFLLNEAELADGTFTEFLAATGTAWEKGTRLSLSQALCKIPEIAYEFKSPDRGPSGVWAARVSAKMGSHSVLLHFDQQVVDEETFRASWGQELPKLNDLYELQPTGITLGLKEEQQPKDYEGLCELCEKTMLNRLLWGYDPTWYVLRLKEGEQEFPRAGYYFIALFILGSIARYQPELLLSGLLPGSEPEWFFNRFMQAAERFFPQLMWSWGQNAQTYFLGL